VGAGAGTALVGAVEPPVAAATLAAGQPAHALAMSTAIIDIVENGVRISACAYGVS
jgi:hypothetical protein